MSAAASTSREIGREPGDAVVAAVLACQEVIVETYALADAGRRSAIADLFTVEGRQTLGDGATVNGRDAIREVLATRDVPGRRTQHVVTNLRFEPVSDDTMRVVSALTLYVLSDTETPSIPRSLSSVEDVLVRRVDRWLLQSRELRFLTGGA